MNKNELQKHIVSTYFDLRIGMGIVAIAFPFLLVSVGLYYGDSFENSMSGYYHTCVRDFFVGMLWAIAGGLYFYKGFSREENIALNFSAFFLVCLAMLPTEIAGPESACQIIKAYPNVWLHRFSAGMFFITIAYVCIKRSSDTLYLIKDETKRTQYRNTYKCLGVAMLVLPVSALLLYLFPIFNQHVLFFIEAFGICVFGFYWLVKSKEIKQTEIDTSVLNL